MPFSDCKPFFSTNQRNYLECSLILSLRLQYLEVVGKNLSIFFRILDKENLPFTTPSPTTTDGIYQVKSTSELNCRSIFQQKIVRRWNFFFQEKNPQDTIWLTQATLKGYFSSFRILIILQAFFRRILNYFLALKRLKKSIHWSLP